MTEKQQEPVTVDVMRVLKLAKEISTDPRKALTAMTVHDLRTLTDAARVGVEQIPHAPKPNGASHYARVVATLEADLAKTRADLLEERGKLDELVADLADCIAAFEKAVPSTGEIVITGMRPLVDALVVLRDGKDGERKKWWR